MSKCIKNCSCYQFADDTCLVVATKNPQNAASLLQSDLNALTKWCHDAGLVLNAKKTKLLIIKSPYVKTSPIPNLVIHNHNCLHSAGRLCSCPPIDVVDKYTYLGLIIDQKFNWSYHIDRVCHKLRQFLANITILNKRIPFKIKIMLYHALGNSYIQYGLSSYGRTYKTYLDAIYKLQLRILKKIVSPKIKNKFYNDDNGLFKHCKILPVHTQVQYLLLIENFFNSSIIKSIEHPVCTRAIAKELVCTRRANNAYGERTSEYLVPRLINNLPLELRHSLTYNNIKAKLKRYFTDDNNMY